MATADEPRARYPYMPFYVDDWLSSDTVDSFTLEQQGAYLRLLLRQWKAKDGMLPADEGTLARWSGLGARWKSFGRPIIASCFVERGDRLVNLRLRELWEAARYKSAQTRGAADLRWSADRKRKIWQQMIAAYSRCLRCGDTEAPLERDHIVQKYRGGDDTPQNWQPLCRKCNAAKGPEQIDYRRGLPETDPSWLPQNNDR